MSIALKKVDMPFLTSVLVLASAGFLIFWSASWGLLARDEARYGSIVAKQVLVGLLPGTIALIILSRVRHELFRTYAFGILVLAVILNLLLFIPGLGLTHGGATRWLDVGSFSFQPSEVLKIASIVYFAAWLAKAREHVHKFSHGFVPFAIMLSIVGLILLAQPDTDTLVVIASALGAMFFYAGAKWRHILIFIVAGALVLGAVAVTRPYVMSRITTFFNPASDSLSAGWQLQQSLVAVGSGGLMGRGFGQSIQKFNYLPEPVGDSIFAVASEEFGFAGATILVLLFVFFTLRAYSIATRSPHPFSGLLVIGIATAIIVQSFINIGAMVGLLPLSGIPLVFISQGGTALFFALASVGIILNVSRSARKAA